MLVTTIAFAVALTTSNTPLHLFARDAAVEAQDTRAAVVATGLPAPLPPLPPLPHPARNRGGARLATSGTGAAGASLTTGTPGASGPDDRAGSSRSAGTAVSHRAGNRWRSDVAGSACTARGTRTASGAGSASSAKARGNAGAGCRPEGAKGPTRRRRPHRRRPRPQACHRCCSRVSSPSTSRSR